MKKLLLLIFVIAQITFCKAQQFTFQMNFEDVVGNKDSLTLGYDNSATDSLNASFGEINIITTPLNSNFDVRVTNEQFNRQHLFTNGTFHTKKKIVTNHCGISGLSIVAIDIYTQHWPVTATWNSLLFDNTCRNGSVFTSMNPGGWWDVGGHSNLQRIQLMQTNQVTFTSQVSDFPSINFAYINNSGDTVSTFWLAMYDSTLLYASIGKFSFNTGKLSIFPNPSADIVSLSIDSPLGDVDRIEFYNTFGQVVLTSKQLNNIDISHLSYGMFFVKVTTRQGLTSTLKFMKI
jgi:hypothetical protein